MIRIEKGLKEEDIEIDQDKKVNQKVNKRQKHLNPKSLLQKHKLKNI